MGIAKWLLTGRFITAKFRALPDFIILGAQKAGTSSLYDYMTQHPGIRAASVKEVHYFGADYSKGSIWYRSHFPYSSELDKAKCITGEATPYYLVHPHAPKRINKLVPDVKLIIVLRDPVERAISHYFHEVRWKHEQLPIAEAFGAEEQRIGPELEKMTRNPAYESYAFQHYSYKKRGVYVDQLKAFAEFFSPEQMLILRSEELFENPDGTMQKVFHYLELDEGFLPEDLQPKNVGIKKHEIPAAVIENLKAYFTPHNKRLSEYLKLDFNW